MSQGLLCPIVSVVTRPFGVINTFFQVLQGVQKSIKVKSVLSPGTMRAMRQPRGKVANQEMTVVGL